MTDLIERLLAVEGGDEGTHWYRNPDGPEAAARIAELEAEVARLRKPFDRCDEEDWRRLDKMLGYSAFGSFWRETLLAVRSTLIEGDDR